jgi:hypothetical protein
MNDLNWEIVFNLKEFKIYYSSWDLNELSMICKKFRNILSSAVFKSFNFNSYVVSNDYKSLKTEVAKEKVSNNDNNFRSNLNGRLYCTNPRGCKFGVNVTYHINPYLPLTEEYIKSKSQFNSNLKNYRTQPTQAGLWYSKYYYYLLGAIPDVFFNLSTLTIAYSHLTVESLQYIFNNLGNLENFELTKCYIFQYSPEEIQTPIIWPTSLIKMKFFDNFASFVKDKLNPIRLYRGEVVSASKKYLKLFPKYLPRLTNLACEVYGQDPEIECLEGFLKLNSQIKRLKIGGSTLSKKTFDIFKSCESLTYLELSYLSYKLSESDLNEFPILNRISYLAVLLRRSEENLHQFILKFPNLTRCLIEAIYGEFDQFYDICIKLPKIKSLRLKQHSNWGHPIEINLPKIENLVGIEFCLHSFSKYERFKINADFCKNLKLIIFVEIAGQKSSDNSKLSPEFTGSWKAVHFLHSLSYYRK